MGKQKRARQSQKEARVASPGGRSAPLPARSLLPSTERAILWGILAFAALLRLFYLLEYRGRSIFYGQLMLDAQVYDEWAQKIAGGAWWGGPVFYHAPLYPYMLAIFYRVLGHHYLPIYLFQLLLGLGAIYLVYRIGKRCASPWIGLAGAALIALYAPLPFFETKIMATSVAIFLSTAALALLVEAWMSGGAVLWCVSGALIGLAALASPASLLWVPCFAVGLLVRRRALGEAVALVLGALVTVAPATLHNLSAGGGLIPISSQGGITFYQGNMLNSRGLYRPVEGMSGSPLTQMNEEKKMAEKEAGHPLRASEVSSFWFGKGLKIITGNPGGYLQLLQLKMLRWFSSLEYSTEYSQAIERSQLTSLWIPFVPFGFLAVGAMAGILLGARTFPRLTPLYFYLLGAIATPMIFYVSSRYRIAAVPVLAVLAAVAVERITARIRERGMLDGLVVALPVLLLGGLTLVPYGSDHLFQEANVHYNAGNLFYDRGDYDTAIEEYRQALQVSDFEFYRVNLGNALTREKRYGEAVEQYRLAIQKNPRFAKAYIQWAKALAQQGSLAEARQIYQRATQLGMRNADVEKLLGGTSTP